MPSFLSNQNGIREQKGRIDACQRPFQQCQNDISFDSGWCTCLVTLVKYHLRYRLEQVPCFVSWHEDQKLVPPQHLIRNQRGAVEYMPPSVPRALSTVSSLLSWVLCPWVGFVTCSSFGSTAASVGGGFLSRCFFFSCFGGVLGVGFDE